MHLQSRSAGKPKIHPSSFIMQKHNPAPLSYIGVRILQFNSLRTTRSTPADITLLTEHPPLKIMLQISIRATALIAPLLICGHVRRNRFSGTL